MKIPWQNTLRNTASFFNKLACYLPGLRKTFLHPPAGYISVHEIKSGISEITVLEPKRVKYENANCRHGTIHPDFETREETEARASLWSFENGIVFSDYGYIIINEAGKNRLVRELSFPLFDSEFADHYFHEKYRWRFLIK